MAKLSAHSCGAPVLRLVKIISVRANNPVVAALRSEVTLHDNIILHNVDALEREWPTPAWRRYGPAKRSRLMPGLTAADFRRTYEAAGYALAGGAA